MQPHMNDITLFEKIKITLHADSVSFESDSQVVDVFEQGEFENVIINLRRRKIARYRVLHVNCE